MNGNDLDEPLAIIGQGDNTRIIMPQDIPAEPSYSGSLAAVVSLLACFLHPNSGR